jgi:hypothetical protein
MTARNQFDCDMSDACYRAVTTVYRELRARGKSDRVSFNSALAVFRHHHPSVLATEAPYIVAEWIE